jgi:hypothetical protein
LEQLHPQLAAQFPAQLRITFWLRFAPAVSSPAQLVAFDFACLPGWTVFFLRSFGPFSIYELHFSSPVSSFSFSSWLTAKVRFCRCKLEMLRAMCSMRNAMHREAKAELSSW